MILQRKDKDPYVCGCCGRQAIAIGYAPSMRAPIMWTCDECTAIAKDVYSMKDATIYEERALVQAGQAVARLAAQELLTALWNAGVTNLDAVDEAKFDEIAALLGGGALTGVVSSAIVAFGDSVRAQLSNGDAPF